MELYSFIQFGLALLVLIIKPGPTMFAFITHSIRYGLTHSYFFALGIMVTELFFFVVAVLGFSALGDIGLFVRIFIQSFAAALLIYLGMSGLRTAHERIEEHPVEKNVKSYLKSLSTGLMITLGNPIPIVFYMSLVPTFFGEFVGNATILVQGMAAILIFEISPYFFAGYALVKSGNFLKRGKRLFYVNIITSLMMIGLGVFVGWSTLPNISMESFYY